MHVLKHYNHLKSDCHHPQRRLFALLAIVLLASLLVVVQVQAAVTLVYFRATGQNNGVLLEWETASELDNAGFFINRSLSQSSGYSRVSEFIPASGDPLLGATYAYTDINITSGITYWYKLETIDYQSTADLIEPPVSAVPGGSRIATPTATQTVPGSNQQTGTVTVTSTTTGNRTPTRTATPRTRVRTSTPSISNPYPAASTLAVVVQQAQAPAGGTTTVNQEQSPSGVVTDTLALPDTGTATLIPLPEITLQFPSAAGVDPLVPTPPTIPPVSITGALGWLTPTRVMFTIFIVFVWLFLGGWFYSTLRRLE